MVCGQGGETFGGVARKAPGIVSNHFSLLWYGKSDMLIFFLTYTYIVRVAMTTYVSTHKILLLLPFLKHDMVTDVLAGLDWLNQCLFEHFVNI